MVFYTFRKLGMPLETVVEYPIGFGLLSCGGNAVNPLLPWSQESRPVLNPPTSREVKVFCHLKIRAEKDV